ncbi:hypothetical protein [Bdellovibrio sp. HCB209]|uniref:hypothetical protein n=1 Tax=Bdellovibrio sp. HCB209 TaxID=3394354 RepID=UPI0039B39324
MRRLKTSRWIQQFATTILVVGMPLFSFANELVDYQLDAFANKINASNRLRIEKVDVELKNHAEVKAEMTEFGPQYVLRVDPKALTSPELMVPAMTYVVQMAKGPALGYMLLELQYNAERGSKGAQAEIRMLELMYSTNPTSRQIVVGALGLYNLVPELEAQEDKIRSQYQDVVTLIKEAQAETKTRERKMQKKRVAEGVLNSLEAQEQKLNDLILRNDRKGVARMLEAYMPWEMMEPFEKATWKGWIEAIEFPDMKNSEVMVRGVDYSTDKVQRLRMADGSERLGFFSTVLTKNQGSYTRRLRSLSTNRVKNGETSFHATTLLTTQLSRHAGDPRASSFVSFTSAPEVAIGFVGRAQEQGKSGGGILAVRVDKRRMLPNMMSSYQQEIERLVPLIIFPDEVIAYRESAGITKMVMDSFVEEVRLKTGVTLQSRNEDSEKMFKKEGADSFKLLLEKNNGFGRSCSNVFM